MVESEKNVGKKKKSVSVSIQNCTCTRAQTGVWMGERGLQKCVQVAN